MPQMYWLNEPEQWSQEGDQLRMFVPPKTDFWRETHYGFTVHDGPFWYCQRSGEFELCVRIQGDYQARYDQMGLMLRIDEKNWLKTGIEYVDGIQYLSAVVTRDKSDWSVISLEEPPKAVWLKLIRKLDAVEISYSLDGHTYQMMRLAHFPAEKMIMTGMTAASPDGDGFWASFDQFRIQHRPDQSRLNWLQQQS
ncbi:MAG: DUF1349 domain-containing protein [Bacteroidota bacterium]